MIHDGLEVSTQCIADWRQTRANTKIKRDLHPEQEYRRRHREAHGSKRRVALWNIGCINFRYVNMAVK